MVAMNLGLRRPRTEGVWSDLGLWRLALEALNSPSPDSLALIYLSSGVS